MRPLTGCLGHGVRSGQALTPDVRSCGTGIEFGGKSCYVIQQYCRRPNGFAVSREG